MKYFSYVCIMENKEYGDYPGISTETFKLVISEEFHPRETLNETWLVINTVDHPNEGMYVSTLVAEEVFRHHQFLYKYSQFMWGLER